MDNRSLGLLLVVAGIAGLAWVAAPRVNGRVQDAPRAAAARNLPDGTYGVQ